LSKNIRNSFSLFFEDELGCYLSKLMNEKSAPQPQSKSSLHASVDATRAGSEPYRTSLGSLHSHSQQTSVGSINSGKIQVSGGYQNNNNSVMVKPVPPQLGQSGSGKVKHFQSPQNQQPQAPTSMPSSHSGNGGVKSQRSYVQKSSGNMYN
jgi:hypothetical protein